MRGNSSVCDGSNYLGELSFGVRVVDSQSRVSSVGGIESRARHC